MRLSDILLGLKYLFIFRFDKTAIFERLEREREIMKVMAILPGHPTFQQVESALKASDVSPSLIYASLTTGEYPIALMLFEAALGKEVSAPADISDDWRPEEWW